MATAKKYPQAQLIRAHLMKEDDRYAEALQWATLAVAQGDCRKGNAQLVLASLFAKEDPEGTTKSCACALYWRRKAEMAGDKESF